MLKQRHIKILMLAMIALMFSCSTSNNVASNKRIQKRKYTKGYYIDTDKKLGGNSSRNDVAITEVITEDEESTTVSKEKDKKKKNKEANNEIVPVETNKEDSKDSDIIEVSEKPTEKTFKADELSTLESAPLKNKNIRERTFTGVKKLVHKIKTGKKLVSNNSSESGLLLLLLVILAILIPPLAVVIYDGVGRKFWIDLILWLVAVGVGSVILGPGAGFLFGVVAVIYALLVIFDVV